MDRSTHPARSRGWMAAAAFALVAVSAEPATGAPRAYVSYGCYACPAGVAVIDTGTNAAIADIPFPLASEPLGVAVHPDGRRVYVGLYRGRGVAVIEAVSNTVIATIDVSSPPSWTVNVAVSPDGGRLYATRSPQPSSVPAPIVVADTATNSVIAWGPDALIAPSGVDVLPDGSRVYVGQYGGAQNVWEISTATNAVTFATPGVGVVSGLVANPAGTRVYAADFNNARVRAVDTTSHAVVATIGVGAGPWGVAIDPAGARAYVANSGSGTVSVIDLGTDTVVGTVGVGAGPHGISVTPDSARIFVANTGSNTVSVIDAGSGSVVATIPVAGPPISLGRFIGPDTACGDGVPEGAEGCDDGNTADGDGCSAACAVEEGWTCGGEPSVCETVCGDGLVRGGEPCDDGNTAAGDGCAADCTVEVGWVCSGSPSVCFRDQPLGGLKLILKRAASGGEKAVFVSKDPAALFPTPGGGDDPRSAGATVDLLSANPGEGSAAFDLPASHWSANAAGTVYKFVNKTAPDATSAVKVAVIKQGKVLKVVAKQAGLPLAAAQGSVGVRIRTGVVRQCARFVGADVLRKDEADKFIGKNAPAAGLADCSEESLLGSPAGAFLE